MCFFVSIRFYIRYFLGYIVEYVLVRKKFFMKKSQSIIFLAERKDK